MKILWILFLTVFYVIYGQSLSPESEVLNGYLFMYWHEGNLNWRQAQNYCEKWGGQLAEVRNKKIEQIIIRFLNADSNVTSAWVGGLRTEMNHWSWIGKTDPVHPGSQDSGFLEQVPAYSFYICAHMRVQESDKWLEVNDTESCEQKLSFICQDKGCNITEGSCKVMLHEKPANWDEAKLICENEDQQLLMLPDKIKNLNPSERYTEFNYLLQNETFEANKYWLGLHFLGWKWTSGDYITFSGSSPRLRDDHYEGKQCLKIHQNGTWEPEACGNFYTGYVCQKKDENNEAIIDNGMTTKHTGENIFVIIDNAYGGDDDESGGDDEGGADDDEGGADDDKSGGDDDEGGADGDGNDDNGGKSENQTRTMWQGIIIIIGVSVGAAVFVVIFIIVFIIIIKRRKKNNANMTQLEGEMESPNRNTYAGVRGSHLNDGDYAYASVLEGNSPEHINPYASSKQVQNVKQHGKQQLVYSEVGKASGKDGAHGEGFGKGVEGDGATAGPVYAVPNKKKKAKNRDVDEDHVVMVENDLYSQRN